MQISEGISNLQSPEKNLLYNLNKALELRKGFKRSLENLLEEFVPEIPSEISSEAMSLLDEKLSEKEKVALKDLLNNMLSYYLYAPDAFRYVGEKPLKEFGINSEVKVRDVFFHSGIWKHPMNPYILTKEEIRIYKDGLPASVSNGKIYWRGNNKEQYLKWVNEFKDKYGFVPNVEYVGFNPELKIIINDDPWEDVEVQKFLEKEYGFKFLNGFEVNNFEDLENLLVDFVEDFRRYPKFVYKGKEIEGIISSHLVNGEDPWEDEKVREFFSQFGEVGDDYFVFKGDWKGLKKLVAKTGYLPHRVKIENTKISRKLSLEGRKSFVNGYGVVERVRERKGRIGKIAGILLAVGGFVGAAGSTMLYKNSSNGYSISELQTKSWYLANNSTLMEAWAKYIFHFPNAPSTNIMDGNLSWLSSGQKAFLNYTWGNFTVDGKSLMTNKTVFDTLFYMVNNASENINGRILARMMAGNQFIQGGTASDYWWNTLPGWGMLDPIELKAAIDIANYNPQFKEYGNLTLALGELNATHNGINQTVGQFLNGVLDVIKNRTWMERRFLEDYYFLTNKSFQWQGSPTGGYISKPVNDTPDLLYFLWNNKTVRDVLGWDQDANATIFWYAGLFGQYLDKGSWNGWWPDERVVKLAIEYIKEMGKTIKNSISIKNSIIALRRTPWVYGASILEKGLTSPFKEIFIENTTDQGDSPYTFTINGTQYQITDPIKYFYDKFWGPNAVYNLRSLVEGKTVQDAWGAVHDWILRTMTNGTNPGGYYNNVTNLLNASQLLLIDNDGNPNNDLRVGVSCGMQADLTAFLFLISPEYVNGTGIVNPYGGIPLSAKVSTTTNDAQNYIPWVKTSGTPILSFNGYDGNVSLYSSQGWTVPQNAVRYHGPGDSSKLAWSDDQEGTGPFWPDIPPGEPWSHYYTNTSYTKLMAKGTFSTYNINLILAGRYFKPIYQKYDLLYNVTADKRSTHYPKIQSDTSVPEIDLSMLPLASGPIAIVYLRRRRKREGILG